MFYIRTRCVPLSKHAPPRLFKTSRLILYKLEAAVCSEIRTQHINTARATHRISECQTLWYEKLPLAFKS